MILLVGVAHHNATVWHYPLPFHPSGVSNSLKCF